jgi:hypothetical protein
MDARNPENLVKLWPVACGTSCHKQASGKMKWVNLMSSGMRNFQGVSFCAGLMASKLSCKMVLHTLESKPFMETSDGSGIHIKVAYSQNVMKRGANPAETKKQSLG